MIPFHLKKALETNGLIIANADITIADGKIKITPINNDPDAYVYIVNTNVSDSDIKEISMNNTRMMFKLF